METCLNFPYNYKVGNKNLENIEEYLMNKPTED